VFFSEMGASPAAYNSAEFAPQRLHSIDDYTRFECKL